MKTNKVEWNLVLLQIALLVFMSVASFTIFSLEAVGTIAYTVANLSVLFIGVSATITAANALGRKSE